MEEVSDCLGGGGDKKGFLCLTGSCDSLGDYKKPSGK